MRAIKIARHKVARLYFSCLLFFLLIFFFVFSITMRSDRPFDRDIVLESAGIILTYIFPDSTAEGRREGGGATGAARRGEPVAGAAIFVRGHF